MGRGGVSRGSGGPWDTFRRPRNFTSWGGSHSGGITITQTVPRILVLAGPGLVTNSSVYDPSGQLTTGTWGAAPAAIPDWGSLAAVFDRYRVTRIRLTFTLAGTQAAPIDLGGTFANMLAGACECYLRYNYDATAVAASLLAETPGVKRFFLTPENPTCTYAFRPLFPKPVFSIATGTPIISALANGAGFIEVPGYSSWLGTIFEARYIPTQYSLYVDIQYTVQFAYRK